MNDITIYGRHTSYNVQKVLWLAEELNINYSHVQRGGRFGGNDTEEFLQLNPMGKVPVLKHGDAVICESNTIVRYLAHQFAANSWIASNPYARSLSERWMDWSIDQFEPAFIGVFWGYYRTPPELRNSAAIQESVTRCETCLSQLGTQLDKQAYLLGANASVADVATGVFLHRLQTIDLKIQFPENVLGWYKALSNRAGYKRWVMSDFSELQGRADY